MVKNFILIGVGGYVAVKHLKAIKEHNHNLLAALDPNDSVGILDSYFPEAFFFTEIERLDRYIEKIKSQGISIDYFVICSPNYLHDAHIRFGLKHGADVICEKPLVLNAWNLDSLRTVEKQTQRKVYNILQMRLHPEVQRIKNYLSEIAIPKVKMELTYIAPRGHWYYASWKGDRTKSGGIVTNIGIHMFDLLHHLFGDVIDNKVFMNNQSRALGQLSFKSAQVDWLLSIENNIDISKFPSINGSVRCLKIGNTVFSFSKSFTDLHNASYENILSDKGFVIDDATNAIRIVNAINDFKTYNSIIESNHPLKGLVINTHPFRETK